MTRLIAILIACSLALTLAACNSTDDTAPPPNGTSNVPQPSSASSAASVESATESEPEATGKILIAYFSRMGNMDFDPDIDAVATATVQTNGDDYMGNNEMIADMLAEKTGGDRFFIEQTEKYPSEYRATTEQVRTEQQNNARPTLATSVEHMEQYSTVILVYPNWWGQLPPAVATFLEAYDFAGKTILPLATNEGSGLGTGPDSIAKLCPNATLLDGLAVRGSSVADAKSDIENWIDTSGILK